MGRQTNAPGLGAFYFKDQESGVDFPAILRVEIK